MDDLSSSYLALNRLSASSQIREQNVILQTEWFTQIHMNELSSSYLALGRLSASSQTREQNILFADRMVLSNTHGWLITNIWCLSHTPLLTISIKVGLHLRVGKYEQDKAHTHARHWQKIHAAVRFTYKHQEREGGKGISNWWHHHSSDLASDYAQFMIYCSSNKYTFVMS